MVSGSDDDEIGGDLGQAVAGCAVDDFATDRDRRHRAGASMPGEFVVRRIR